jgi:glycosyltransferase involved in cell wall biosynthesis
MATNKFLFLLHLPGPVHGSSIVGSYYQKYIVNKNDIVFPIQLAKNKLDIGRFSLLKLLKASLQLFNILLLSFKVEKFVLFYTSSGSLLYRDIIITKILWRKRGYLVMHNKGINDAKIPDFLLKSFFKNCEVILLAESLYSDVEKFVKYGDIHITPNCLFETRKIAPIEKNYSTLKFLFLSNLLKSKGVMEAIALVKNLYDRGLNVHLDLVGMEMDVTMVEIQKSINGYEDVITFHGPQYGNSKDQFLEKCNILIFPTRYPKECYPLVIIEAFAHSIPVLSLDNGAIRDIIDNDLNGYVFDISASVEIMEGWVIGKTEDEWKNMSVRAYDAYVNLYQLDQWIDITKKALSS